MTSRSGTSFFNRRTVCWTIPLRAQAPDAFSSLRSGMPNNSTAGTPSSYALEASLSSSSGESWKTPGMALFIALLWVRLPGRSAPPKIQNTATILQQIQTLSELVTVKYVLERVVILEDIKWYGENRVLLVAHGVVKAGVDLQEIKPEDVRVEDKRVIVRLPRAKITDVYLDEHKTRVVDRTTGILRS